jgi:hypothetical protein
VLGVLLSGAGAIVILVARIRGDFSGRRYRPAELSIGAALALARYAEASGDPPTVRVP